ncbi:glycosyltransferase [Clostridium sp. AL.422]|uniref:glycosyltransferase n=1 Tax=Clostridium TaxID=1485 RepID=UPI00293DE98D|nr:MULTISPECIES: glycosyltransferase [unclassified Clostridium]MDV4150428.1 glycosyltransferase [Clostridium sp. AL.422]
MSKVMISIILPIYNVEKYLQECLESILNQSYKDYELIIVDDGSKDNSLKIVNSYKEKFKNLVILTQENKGVSVARNLALSYANGDYISFVDSDDFLDEKMLEKVMKIALKTDAEIVITNYYLYYNKENIIKFLKDMPYFGFYDSSEIIDMMLKYKIQGQLWNKIFKRSLLNDNGFEFERGRYIQDIFPVFKIIYNAKKIAYIDKALYFYRQREGSTVHKKNEKLTEDYYYAMQCVINYIEEKQINVSKNSLRIFKIYVLSYFIYHYTNENIRNSYKTYKKSHYKDLNICIKEFLFLKEVYVRDKLRIVLWKLGIFNYLKKVKKSYE